MLAGLRKITEGAKRPEGMAAETAHAMMVIMSLHGAEHGPFWAEGVAFAVRHPEYAAWLVRLLANPPGAEELREVIDEVLMAALPAERNETQGVGQ